MFGNLYCREYKAPKIGALFFNASRISTLIYFPSKQCHDLIVLQVRIHAPTNVIAKFFVLIYHIRTFHLYLR